MFASARFWLFPLALWCAAPALAAGPLPGMGGASHGPAPGTAPLIGAPGLPAGPGAVAPPPHLSLAYGARGELLTVWNGTARLWNGADATPLHAWGCAARIEAAWFTADGARVVAAHGPVGDGAGVNRAGTALFAVADGAVLHRWPGLAPALDADGRAWITRDGQAILGREGDAFRLLYTARGGQGARMAHPGATHLALSPDGRHALSGAADGGVILWRTDSGGQRLVRDLGAPVTGLAFSFDGAHAAVATARGTTVWTVPDGRTALASDDPWAKLSPLDPYLLEARGNGAALRRLADGGAACTWRHNTRVAASGFAQGGTRAFVVGPERAEVWRVQGCAADAEGFTLAQRPRIQGFALAPDGAQALTAGAGTARLWVFPTRRRPTATYMNWPNPGGGAYPAHFAPDGARLATAESAATARIVALPSGAVAATLSHGDDAAHCQAGQVF